MAQLREEPQRTGSTITWAGNAPPPPDPPTDASPPDAPAAEVYGNTPSTPSPAPIMRDEEHVPGSPTHGTPAANPVPPAGSGLNWSLIVLIVLVLAALFLLVWWMF